MTWPTCPWCGAPVAGGATTCPRCYRPLAAAAPQPAAPYGASYAPHQTVPYAMPPVQMAYGAAPAGPWQATHRTPRQEISFWAQPDGALPAAGTLPRETPVRFEEVRGPWARVSASNGWSGWVDGQLLQPAGGAAPAGLWISPWRAMPALGGILVIAATFIDWTPFFSAMDWGAPGALWASYGTTVRFGIITLILGAVALLLSLLPRTIPWLRVVGVLVVLVCIAFMVSAARLGGAAEGLKALRAGFYMTLVSGLLISVSPR